MDSAADTTAREATPDQLEAPSMSSEPGKQVKYRLSPAILDWLILLGVTITALIPRINLATQLDLVTDEGIYIIAGKLYLPLFMKFNIIGPGWTYNYEHPPFVKLLIGAAMYLDDKAASPIGELLAARVPSILFGTLLIVAIYWLGRAPFGRVIALLAALCLAVSPWLVYFSALAYLDMTMTALITIAYLLTWHAIRKPWLYLLSALLVGLGVASKYTAALVIPGIVLFTAYYFLALRPRLPVEQRPRVPWLWWFAALLLSPLTFFVVDIPIWTNPFTLLMRSFRFEWVHSIAGHLTFLAGHYSGHVPQWAILYIVLAKISAFVTIPAVLFVLFALIQLIRLHLKKPLLAFRIPGSGFIRQATNSSPSTIESQVAEATSMAFLLIWLLSMLGMFSLLNIVVGTHYHLPVAPPVALAGASGLAFLLGYRRGALFHSRGSGGAINWTPTPRSTPSSIPTAINWEDTINRPLTLRSTTSIETTAPMVRARPRLNLRAAIIVVLLSIFLVGPHLYGLITVAAAEGYTSELFSSENDVVQVAYPGYREAGLWLLAHTKTRGRVGLVAIPRTLTPITPPWLQVPPDVSWIAYNHDLEGRLQFIEEGRLQFIEAHPRDPRISEDYLVWPMHLVQRGYTIPEPWRSRIVYTVKGGNTIYSFIMARNPATILR